VINPPYLDKLHALERHGGQPYGTSGAMNERGRPVIPLYQYDPDAIEILWNWLYAQPGIARVQSEIVVEPDRVATGEGDSHKEALCLAVLALSQGRPVAVSQWPTGQAHL